MTEILNFADPQQAFGPEAINGLSLAFEEAWEKIKKSGGRFAKPGYASAAREIIARRILRWRRPENETTMSSVPTLFSF